MEPSKIKLKILSASLIPLASENCKNLIDIGGTVFWVPIYTNALGYERVIIVELEKGMSVLDDYYISDEGKDFLLRQFKEMQSFKSYHCDQIVSTV